MVTFWYGSYEFHRQPKRPNRNHAMQSKTNVNNPIRKKTPIFTQTYTISVLFIIKLMQKRHYEANNISSKLTFFALILKILR